MYMTISDIIYEFVEFDTFPEIQYRYFQKLTVNSIYMSGGW